MVIGSCSRDPADNGPVRLQTLEMINAPQAPWRTPAFTEIDIEPDGDNAISLPTMENRDALANKPEPATVLNDSMSALQSIFECMDQVRQEDHPSNTAISSRAGSTGDPTLLQWVPGHCSDPGNEAADRLAKEAVGPDREHPFQHLLSQEKRFIRNKIQTEWEQEWKTSEKGSHIRRIDRGLQSIRTRRMYDSLQRNQAASPNGTFMAGNTWQTTPV